MAPQGASDIAILPPVAEERALLCPDVWTDRQLTLWEPSRVRTGGKPPELASAPGRTRKMEGG